MSPKSLFMIMLKTLGIFFIKDIVIVIPQLISAIILLGSDAADNGLWTFGFTLVMLVVYILIAYYLVFKTTLIIDKLKLDQEFDEDSLTLNIPVATILMIALIVTGAFILTNEIPNLCRALFSYFREKRMTYGQMNPDISYVIFSAVKIMIGLLLIGERKRIVEFIERRQADTLNK